MKTLVLAVMTLITVIVLLYISDALHYERWSEAYEANGAVRPHPLSAEARPK